MNRRSLLKRLGAAVVAAPIAVLVAASVAEAAPAPAGDVTTETDGLMEQYRALVASGMVTREELMQRVAWYQGFPAHVLTPWPAPFDVGYELGDFGPGRMVPIMGRVTPAAGA